MKAIKRVEIIVSTLELETVTALLEKSGVSGYSIIKRVTGKGSRGIQDGEGLSDAFMNCYILVGCSPEELEQFMEPLRNLLGESGGVCFVTDAWSVKH